MIFLLLNDLLHYLQANIPERTFELNSLPDRNITYQCELDCIHITLLNVAEDSSSRIPYTRPQPGAVTYRPENPPVNLNLNLIISCSFKQYGESLKALSEVITTINSKQVFITEKFKYTVTLQSLTIDQNIQLWSAFSAGILPNVIYKIRSVPTGN
ncbi:Pvc16 family protein [Kaistella antarctica]|uniref:Pvc16 N-terminal domain-containing protein n=1 Tax=Kaistella antarctica TaxID=266748 RepID=A0A448NQG8_9FLAO|nr:Pvc16 family protein [Kaistella antarctica]KEY19080.1 hypothetical protein HY04_11645 [Kaistella antarctica]SEW11841.1 Protein of unknown function [Kaistella antarctica]VEH98923.1 Uncharacterised protein [Kaistella antarctica]